MATIQSAINQMLNSATIGVGLFAHSPEGKKLTEFRNKKTELKALDKKEAQGLSTTADVQKQAQISSEMFNLRPTEKNLDIEQKYASKLEKTQKTLAKSEEIKKAREKAMEERARFLEGVEELKEYGWKAVRDKYTQGGNE